MPSRITQVFHRGSLVWAAIVVAACCGCASVPNELESRDESFSEAAQYQRKPEKTTLPFAVSDKARQVEQDFGVRR